MTTLLIENKNNEVLFEGSKPDSCFFKQELFLLKSYEHLVTVTIYSKKVSISDAINWCNNIEKEKLEKKNKTHKRVYMNTGVCNLKKQPCPNMDKKIINLK